MQLKPARIEPQRMLVIKQGDRRIKKKVRDEIKKKARKKYGKKKIEIHHKKSVAFYKTGDFLPQSITFGYTRPTAPQNRRNNLVGIPEEKHKRETKRLSPKIRKHRKRVRPWIPDRLF